MSTADQFGALGLSQSFKGTQPAPAQEQPPAPSNPSQNPQNPQDPGNPLVPNRNRVRRGSDLISPNGFVNAFEEQDQVVITQNEYRDAGWVPSTYSELMRKNDEREALLDDARRYSPLTSVFHLQKLPQTVLWRMLCFPMTWTLFVVYLTVALLTRYGVLSLGSHMDLMTEAFSGADVLVTFMVVFYLGYCYTRHFEIYNMATAAKSTIVNLCGASRACLPITARRKLFMHLNLMHVSAYCALTPIYNFDNFMETFCKLHHLETPNFEATFGDVDTSGGTHYNRCAVWVQAVLVKALKEGQLHPEAFRNMQEEVFKLRGLFASIFAYQYQVIPFSYSHLVSFGCFLYLLGLAIAKAMRFEPDTDYFGGLVLPALSFLIAMVTTVGLIEIGQAISDPWGNDPEDFAVPRFLHGTAKMTRLLIEGVEVDPLATEATIEMGDVELDHVPLEGQSRHRRQSLFARKIAAVEPNLPGATALAPRRRESLTAGIARATAAAVARERASARTSSTMNEADTTEDAAAKIQALARGNASRSSDDDEAKIQALVSGHQYPARV